MSRDYSSILKEIQAEQVEQQIQNGDASKVIAKELTEIKDLLSNNLQMSQSAAHDGTPSRDYSERSQRWEPNRSRPMSGGGYKGASQEFMDAFNKELKETFLGPMRQGLTNSVKELSNALGVELKDLPKGLGQSVAQSLSKSLVGKAYGKSLEKATSSLSTGISQAAANITASGGKLSAGFGSLLKGAAGAAKAMGPWAIAIGVALKALETLGPAIEGITQFFGAMRTAASRGLESSQKQLALAQERFKQDVNDLVREPFEILKESAQEVYNAWDNTVSKINATQGYTKSDLQDLMAAFAERLRSENLTSYVAGTDIINNLSRVLESGLSGRVAEEFAYEATKLNKAVPTQDFFSYASTYASIAANILAEGGTEADALQEANNQLEDFASNVLYASRQISGGFSTGLTNASSLLEDASKIAIAAKTNNTSNISAALTSIAAIVGAMAPDLASGLISTVTSAALGGNSSNYTALRSLAGTGASNTAFLQALAADPQGVFATMFMNLGQLQNMSSGNYMEVAEGLSQIFGVSMDAFARVDFAQLADAVYSMSANNAALEQNMALLVEGQTTTTAEQLKTQQINEYMIEEGLSYVLDNEVARSIQEHMWDEELNRELMEATYGVELVGSTATLLQGIAQTITLIKRLFDPSKWLSGAANVAITQQEGEALSRELQDVIASRVVGQGSSYIHLLTATGRPANDHFQTASYLKRLTGKSGVNERASAIEDWYAVSGQTTSKNVNAWYSSLMNSLEDVYGSKDDRLIGSEMGSDYLTADWSEHQQKNKMSSSVVNGLANLGRSAVGLIGSVVSPLFDPSTSTTAAAADQIVKGLDDATGGALSQVDDWWNAGVGVIESWLRLGSTGDRSPSYSTGAGRGITIPELAAQNPSAAFAPPSGQKNYVLIDGKYYSLDQMQEEAQAIQHEEEQKIIAETERLDLALTEGAQRKAHNEYLSKYGYKRYMPASMYDWGLVGKSGLYTGASNNQSYYSALTSAAATSKQVEKIETVIAGMGAAAEDKIGYDEYLQKMGVSNVEDLVAGTNVTAQDLQYMYETEQTNVTSQEKQKLEDAQLEYYTWQLERKDAEEAVDSAVLSYIKAAEQDQSEDAILQLANSLASGVSDLTDPTQQQNALLSKILLVCEAIMQQNNGGGGMSLPSTLLSLATGGSLTV